MFANILAGEISTIFEGMIENILAVMISALMNVYLARDNKRSANIAESTVIDVHSLETCLCCLNQDLF